MTKNIPPSKKMALNRLKRANNDMVDHPSHYINGGKECIDLMIDEFGVDKVITWCELNSYKYGFRRGKKAISSDKEDMAKALWYENKVRELNNLNNIQ